MHASDASERDTCDSDANNPPNPNPARTHITALVGTAEFSLSLYVRNVVNNRWVFFACAANADADDDADDVIAGTRMPTRMPTQNANMRNSGRAK